MLSQVEEYCTNLMKSYKNVTTDANSHQYHVLAITRNLRRFYGAQLARASLLLQNSRNQTHLRDIQLEREQLYQSQTAIHSIISRIEEKEELGRL